jgi:hypothetical protein
MEKRFLYYDNLSMQNEFEGSISEDGKCRGKK